MPHCLHVLLVDADRRSRETVKRVLERFLLDLEVEEVATRDALSSVLGREGTDLVITETDLPGTEALEVLHAIREERPRVPAILFTAASREAVVMEAVKAGFDDYVLKVTGCEGRLESAVRSALLRMGDNARAAALVRR
jgi:CheY-like chemotaxis protein